jgi:Uncharacterised nucleotidyltransferase
MRRSVQDPCRHVLLCLAREVIDGVAAGAVEIDNWDGLLCEAEANHLTPLFDAFVRRYDRRVPDHARQQLCALMLRHRAWHQARTAALTEILDAFDRRSLRAAVLKGAALAWLIYPAPHLRPMVDVDLLLPRARAGDAQGELRRLGFRAEDAPRPFGRNAHHLPVASRQDSRLTINVEIHLDALSRDSLSSITLDNLTEPLRPFLLNGHRRLTLGHVDMLRHLAHHLLEPSLDGYVRLIGVVDLVRYARIFNDEIDWRHVVSAFPFVTNILACLHQLVPLPAELGRFAPSPSATAAGIGETMRPLRSIARVKRPLTATAVELFRPPAWWMHAYYNVPLHASLRTTRLVRHPWHVARWLALRVVGF